MVVRFERFPMVRTPFSGVFDLERGVEDIFGGVLGRSPWSERGVYPTVDVASRDNDIVVVAELPGAKKEDVKVSLENGFLTISGERKQHALPENSVWLRNEIPTGTFNRVVELPHDVKTDQVNAELVNGILTIVFPKAEEARSREIEVR